MGYFGIFLLLSHLYSFLMYKILQVRDQQNPNNLTFNICLRSKAEPKKVIETYQRHVLEDPVLYMLVEVCIIMTKIYIFDSYLVWRMQLIFIKG